MQRNAVAVLQDVAWSHERDAGLRAEDFLLVMLKSENLRE